VQGGRLTEVRFKAKGCVPAMACGSLITEMLQGKSVSEAGTISREEVVQHIGGLPPASGHAAQLTMDALQGLLQRIRNAVQ
jgi:nitrogen fixation NifU-like protein